MLDYLCCCIGLINMEHIQRNRRTAVVTVGNCTLTYNNDCQKTSSLHYIPQTTGNHYPTYGVQRNIFTIISDANEAVTIQILFLCNTNCTVTIEVRYNYTPTVENFKSECSNEIMGKKVITLCGVISVQYT
jgi:hypothetical protein